MSFSDTIATIGQSGNVAPLVVGVIENTPVQLMFLKSIGTNANTFK